MFKKAINIFEIVILLFLILVIFSLMFPPEAASRTFRFYSHNKFIRILLDSLLILAFVVQIVYLITSFKVVWKEKIKRFQRSIFLIGIIILLFDIGFWFWFYILVDFSMPLYLIFSILFSLPILFWLVEFYKIQKVK